MSDSAEARHLPMDESSATEASSAAAEADSWISQKEKGTVWGIYAGYYLATAFGRAPVRALLWFVSLYYVLFRPKVAQASRQWLRVVHEREPKFVDVWEHVRCFAQMTADRIFFLREKTSAFRITRRGDENLSRALSSGRGAILLGAHLGSFEALRADGQDIDTPITILGHFENARMINALFQKLNPSFDARVIHIGRGSVDFIFKVQEAIERGELVGTMGDRVGLNEKSVTVEFFGRPARFPTGPFVLASILKCPVFLTFGLFHQPNTYNLSCEPFEERVVLPRKGRDEQLQALVQSYAHRLEEYCRQAPNNWSNFYDFWEAPVPPAGKTPGPG